MSKSGCSCFISKRRGDNGDLVVPMKTSRTFPALEEEDLRTLVDKIWELHKIIEGPNQGNAGQSWQGVERKFWPKLTCLPVLKELLGLRQPDMSVLEPFFPKGENTANTLANMIIDHVQPPHCRLAIALISAAAAMETVEEIQHNRDECLQLFRDLRDLAKILYELKDPISENKSLQDEMTKGVNLLLEGSIMCSIQVNYRYLKRNLKASFRKEAFLNIKTRMDSTNKALTSMSETLFFQGIRSSSPLQDHLNMSYPYHAVGIEEQRKKIAELLDWTSPKKAVAVIVSGAAGTGKTTLSDAVFTTIHVPFCNYSRYTWFDRAAENAETQSPVSRHWIQDKPTTKEEGDDEEYEESDAGDDDKKIDINDNESNGDPATLPELESRSDEHEQKLRVCLFVYFDNASGGTSALTQELRSSLLGTADRIRILVTTRNREPILDECKLVLPDDCIREFRMTTTQMNPQEQAKIVKSAMGDSAWETLFPGPVSMERSSLQKNGDLQRLIALCHGLPVWLFLAGKYIRSCLNLQDGLNRLLSDSSSASEDEKWRRLASVMTQGSLADELMRALKNICSLYHGNSMDQLENVVLKRVLNDLKDRGLVCTENFGVRVPFPIWKFCISCSKLEPGDWESKSEELLFTAPSSQELVSPVQPMEVQRLNSNEVLGNENQFSVEQPISGERSEDPLQSCVSSLVHASEKLESYIQSLRIAIQQEQLDKEEIQNNVPKVRHLKKTLGEVCRNYRILNDIFSEGRCNPTSSDL